LSKDRLEVVKVDCGIASILLFRINIPSFSKSIWFGTEMTKIESDDKVELEEILGLLHLFPDQHLGSRKILKVFMIHNNIDGIGQTFQIVLPNLKSFKDGKQFLVICVVVQLHYSESVRVKGHQMNFIIFVNNGEDCRKSVVQSINFHNKLNIRNPMSKDRSRGKDLLERVESIMTEGVKLPRNVLLGETCQWNNNVQIIEDKPVIEISKA